MSETKVTFDDSHLVIHDGDLAIKKAVAAERERCAKIAETLQGSGSSADIFQEMEHGRKIASAIRTEG